MDHTAYLHSSATVLHEHKHTGVKILCSQVSTDFSVRLPEMHTVDIQMSLRERA